MYVMMVLLNYSLRIIGFLLPIPNVVQSRWLSSCQDRSLCPPGPCLLLGDFLGWCHPPWSLLGSWRESIKTFRPLLDSSPGRPAGHPGPGQKLPRQFAGPDWSAPAQLPGSEFSFVSRECERWQSFPISLYLLFLSIDCLKYWWWCDEWN